MKVLFWGMGIFFLAFFLHLLIWRIRIPKMQTRGLLQIFFGTFIIGIITLWSCSINISIFGLIAPNSFLEYLHISMFFISLTLAYIVTYSGMEVDSPSLLMTMKIAESGSDGLTKENFYGSLSDDILMKPRVRDLVRDNTAHLDGGKYRITPKGARIARIFIFYRRLLNITLKGG